MTTLRNEPMARPRSAQQATTNAVIAAIDATGRTRSSRAMRPGCLRWMGQLRFWLPSPVPRLRAIGAVVARCLCRSLAIGDDAVLRRRDAEVLARRARLD